MCGKGNCDAKFRLNLRRHGLCDTLPVCQANGHTYAYLESRSLQS